MIHRHDRNKSVYNEFLKLNDSSNQSWTYIDAIKPSILEAKLWAKPPLWKNDTRYVQAAYGCLKSHVKAVLHAKRRQWHSVLILEDDFYFKQNALHDFNHALRILENMDWDVLYLGGTHIDPPVRYQGQIHRVRKTLATHAYIISRNMYSTIIRRSIEFGKEIDVFYTDVIQSKYKVYAIVPGIVGQKPGHSDVVGASVAYDFINK